MCCRSLSVVVAPACCPDTCMSNKRDMSASHRRLPAHAGRLVDRRASETSGARSGLRSSASASSHRWAASLLKILQDGPDRGHLTAKVRQRMSRARQLLPVDPKAAPTSASSLLYP